MGSRWDYLYDLKPVPLIEHVLDEAAKRVVASLEKWPLEIDALDPVTGAQFRSLLDPDARRPDARVYREAVRLARWDLERDTAAYDDYLRNRRWLEHGLAPDDKRALLFISRWLIEQLLTLSEHTEGRVTRRHLLACLERIERRLASTAAVLAGDA